MKKKLKLKKKEPKKPMPKKGLPLQYDDGDIGEPSEMKYGGRAKDGKWIQKAVNPAHKGFCTPLTKSTCTKKRKALALTFKKMARNRKKK